MAVYGALPGTRSEPSTSTSDLPLVTRVTTSERGTDAGAPALPSESAISQLRANLSNL